MILSDIILSLLINKFIHFANSKLRSCEREIYNLGTQKNILKTNRDYF